MSFWNWVEPNVLAAGSVPTDAEQIHVLPASGIRSILWLTEQPLTAVPTISSNLITRLGIEHRYVPNPDYFPLTTIKQMKFFNITMQDSQC